MQSEIHPRIPITPRKPGLSFTDEIPRHWFGGNPLATHLANGLNLLFPAGERFFVRSVRKYMDQIDDPALLEQIRGFMGQEGRHAHEHERFFEIMEKQGLEIRSFLDAYENITYNYLEKWTPAWLNLSATVAAEHFTASFAHKALTRDELQWAHPVMQQLLRWHACEEIEHKAVAFDVLQKVHPGYLARVAGLLYATLGLSTFWAWGAIHLLRQEPKRAAKEWAGHAQRLRERGQFAEGLMAAAFLAYLRPGFHPWDVDDRDLAERYLASREWG